MGQDKGLIMGDRGRRGDFRQQGQHQIENIKSLSVSGGQGPWPDVGLGCCLSLEVVVGATSRLRG